MPNFEKVSKYVTIGALLACATAIVVTVANDLKKGWEQAKKEKNNDLKS